MKYDLAQINIEEHVRDAWAETTALQYDNVSFDTEPYEEFCKLAVIFGQGVARTLGGGCYRQNGVVMFSVFVKPATGTARMDQLARQAAEMFTSAIWAPTDPTAPTIKFRVPSVMRDLNEKHGWVMAQVSCPFYYDI